MLASWGLTGCYRYADVPIERVQSLQSGSDGRSLEIALDRGERRKFEDYDELVVEVGPLAGVGADELELETPHHVKLDAKSLSLSTTGGTYELSRRDVKEVTLQRYAPSRPYVIAGVALGAMLLGGFLGASSQSCQTEDELCGLGRGAAGLLGGTIGLGLGLGISIPLTAVLHPDTATPAAIDAQAGTEPWRPQDD
jgi:hypothetical protein